MSSPSTAAPNRASLAATFPPFRKTRDPLHIRQSKVARRLANRGAMEPEGCTAEELRRARDTHRLRVEGMHDILRTLWSFRLLGYTPADTVGRSYADIAAIVAAGTKGD